MSSTKPKVLVTGASGLLGGLAVKHLQHKYEFSALNRSRTADSAHTRGFASLERIRRTSERRTSLRKASIDVKQNPGCAAGMAQSSPSSEERAVTTAQLPLSPTTLKFPP